jgi:hypothetical protein
VSHSEISATSSLRVKFCDGRAGIDPDWLSADAPIEERTAPQTVDARLWQDPFAAIQKSLEKSGNQDPVQKCQGALSDDRRCKSPLDAEDKETLVLAVTVPGAPYQEDAERRMRSCLCFRQSRLRNKFIRML